MQPNFNRATIRWRSFNHNYPAVGNPPALIKIPIKAVADPEGLAKLYVVQAKDGLCCVSVEGIDMVSFRIDHNEGLTPRELAIANNCAVDVSMVAYPDKESLEWLFTLIN